MEEGPPPAQSGRPGGEGVPGQPGPSPPPAASAQAPGPPEQVHKQEEGVSPLQERVSVLMEEVSRLSAENQSLKEKSPDQEERKSHLSAENQWLKRQVHVLGEVMIHLLIENQQLKLPGQDPGEVKSHLPVEFPRVEQQDHDQDEVTRLSAENQRLKQQVDALTDVVSHYVAENNQLKPQRPDREEPVTRPKQEVPLRSRQGASGAQQTAKKTLLPLWSSQSIGRTPDKDFCVQIRTAGKTGGCEEKFLKDVSKCLSRQGVSLQVKEFRGTSRNPLLLFCPIASCMRNDIENALEGLGGEQKVLLVVMHYVQKENPGPSVNAKQPVPPPAVVLTVHTRFTLQDGLYPCKMNEVAVADVAAAIKDLAEDQ